MFGSTDGVMGLITQRMDYLKQRQAVIAQNVANADTPEYKSRDLVKFSDAMKGVGVNQVDMAVSDKAHIAPAGRRIGGNYGDNRAVKSYETMPSGNSVVLEEQMMKAAEVGADYRLVTQLYRSQESMVKLALGRPQ